MTVLGLEETCVRWDIAAITETFPHRTRQFAICNVARLNVLYLYPYLFFFSCQRGHFNSMVVVLNVKKYGDNSNSTQLCSSFNCIRIPGTSPTTGPRSGRTTVLPTTKHDEDCSDFFTHWSKCRVLWIANALWTAGSSGDECGGGAHRQLLYSVVHNRRHLASTC